MDISNRHVHCYSYYRNYCVTFCCPHCKDCTCHYWKSVHCCFDFCNSFFDSPVYRNLGLSSWINYSYCTNQICLQYNMDQSYCCMDYLLYTAHHYNSDSGSIHRDINVHVNKYSFSFFLIIKSYKKSYYNRVKNICFNMVWESF